MRKLVILALLLFASPLLGQTIRNCDGTEADCQSKVDLSANGDTVQVPAGSFTWPNNGGRSIGWQGKWINIIGASSPLFSPPGTGQTIITNNDAGSKIFYNKITDPTQGKSRISGFTFKGTNLNTCVHIDAGSALSVSTYGFRVDHNDFNNCTIATSLSINGITWGVVDHNTFEGDSDHVLCYNNTPTDFSAPGTLPGNGQRSWNLPIGLGDFNALYVEDNTFTETTGALAVNDMEYGCRYVFRHNVVNNSYFQSHSPRSSNRGGALRFEVYNNTFNGNGGPGGPAPLPFLLLGGTGVIFNNTIIGYSGGQNIKFGDQRSALQIVQAEYWECRGTADAHGPPTPYTWDGNIETSGWPCMDQIGRGPGTQGSQPSLPALLWNNGTTATCATGGTCDNASGVILNGVPAGYIQTTAHSNGDKDYCIGTTMPTVCGNVTTTYTPGAYPHPLVGVAAPIATFCSASLTIGLVPVGLTSNPVNCSLTNTGNANLVVSHIAFQSTAIFTIINNTCGSPATITSSIPGTGVTLTPTSSCTFQVQATAPSTAQVWSDNIIFTDNNPSTGTDTLPLQITSTGPPAPAPTVFAWRKP